MRGRAAGGIIMWDWEGWEATPERWRSRTRRALRASRIPKVSRWGRS